MTLPTPYYQDADVTLYHGDSLMLLTELDSIGAIITDPPYSSGGAMRGDRMASTVAKYVRTDAKVVRPDFSGDTRDQRAYFAWSTFWLSFALHACRPSALCAVFTDWRQLPTLTDAIQAGGWCWRGIATWWKPGIRMQRGLMSSSAEYVCWGTAGPTDQTNPYSPQNVIKCAPVKEKEHIAEKPAAVMDWLVRLCPPDAVLLDPFAGSGQTLLAARRAGIRSVGFEIEERYCEMIAKTMAQSVLPQVGLQTDVIASQGTLALEPPPP